MKIYTAKEAAVMLHVSLRTLQRYRNDGLIEFTQLGRKVFFIDQNIEDFIRQYKKSAFNFKKSILNI